MDLVSGDGPAPDGDPAHATGGHGEAPERTADQPAIPPPTRRRPSAGVPYPPHIRPQV